MSEAESPERVVLVLQGGGALGCYQAGAYEALAAAGHEPDWIAGISIGAINGAIIAGNPPERRRERLRLFWERVSSGLPGHAPSGDPAWREIFNEISAASVAAFGAPGFFRPRLPPDLWIGADAARTPAWYDAGPLMRTLAELVDFDRLNSGETRLSVGAVAVRTGNFVYFDTATQRLGPEHIAASGALPPGLPAVAIDGELYWDGGLVSNTPLQYVLDDGGSAEDTLVFQIDLFSAAGPLPLSFCDVAQREKEIRFSSRTRLNTDVFLREQTMRRALRRLLDRLPPDLATDPDALLLAEESRNGAVTIVQLIHRSNAYETQSKDYEFSRMTMRENWDAGAADVRSTLGTPAWAQRVRPELGVSVFDFTSDAARRGRPRAGPQGPRPARSHHAKEPSA